MLWSGAAVPLRFAWVNITEEWVVGVGEGHVLVPLLLFIGGDLGPATRIPCAHVK